MNDTDDTQVIDQTTEQPEQQEALGKTIKLSGQTFNNLDEIQTKFDGMEKGFTRASQENSEMRKRLADIEAKIPAQIEPEVPSYYANEEVRRAREALINSGITDRDTVAKMAEEIAERKFNEATSRAKADSYLDKFNSNAKVAGLKIEDSEEIEKYHKLIKAGLDHESATYALRGKEIAKQIEQDAKSFNPRKVNGAQNNQVSGNDNTGLKKEDMTTDKFSDNFDKIFADVNFE